MRILLDDETIRDLARAVSLEGKTFDELVWLFAEAELRILSTLVVGHLRQEGGEVREVEVDPTLLVDQPEEDEIRVLATEIAQMKPTPALPDLHWFIAERRFIFNQAKAALKRSKGEKTLRKKSALKEEDIF